VKERFGIHPEVFKNYVWFRRQNTWWMVRSSPFLENAGALKISFAGLRAFTKIGQFIKPSTRMIQVFGKNATKSRLQIEKEDLMRLLRGETLHIESEQENGYLVLSYEGDILGLGLLLKPLVHSQLPRHYKKFIDPFFQAIP
jgi:NOL1/NOP2/fmu family ribosome biogenesis protein